MDDEIFESASADQDNVVMNSDGSATFLDLEDIQGTASTVHDANLAVSLSESAMTAISMELMELYKVDKQSNSRKDQLYEEGLRRTGLGKDAPGGAQFSGASRAVHPALAEACVDYSSAAIKELFPPDGPVRIHDFADFTRPDEIERAEAKRDFMNWQLVEQIPEYRSELEVLLTQQPLSGAQYLKIWQDPRLKRPCVEFVPSDLVVLPFAATNFVCANRAALIVPLTKYDYERRVESGMYRQVDVVAITDPMVPDETAAQVANHKIVGTEAPMYNEDGLRNFLEFYVDYDVEGFTAPYIITIDENTEKVVAIYRNWEETDETKQKLEWVVEFPFIPWRGAGGIGLTHLIGSLAASATGALRALLDSAHLHNFPGAVKLKGARASGQNITINATEITEIEAPNSNTDDIRKVMMPLPFPAPSPTLFQLLGWLTDAARAVVTTAEEKIAEAKDELPVGTTLALIEQGSKVTSAIHMRQHEAQKRVLAILQRLNHKYYDEQLQVKRFGRVIVPRDDFLETGNIVPVSDPHMFSESQRYAQVQGVLQMASDTSVPWNKLAIYKRALRIMHVHNPQELLNEPPPPVSADPISEIMAAMSGRQLAAQPQMNHVEHIREELSFLLDTMFGAANPEMVNPGFAVIMADINQHLMFLYQQMKQQSVQQAQAAVAQQIATQLAGRVPPEQVQQVVLAQMQQPGAVQIVMATAPQVFVRLRGEIEPLNQQVQAAAKLVKAKTPPPTDPQAQAAIQVASMQEDTKKQIAALKHQLDQEQAAAERRMAEAKLDLERLQRLILDPQVKESAQRTEIVKNDADNKQHQTTELLKNHEDNQTNLIIAQVREQGETDRKIEELQQQAIIEIFKPEDKESKDGQGNSAP